jgi:tetratricopeptide (TPR) repeat protein
MSQTGVILTDVHADRIDITGVTVGLTASEVQELTKAAAAGAVGPLTATIVELGQRLGVTQFAALTMLRSLGHDDVPVERLPDTLAAAATQILVMRQALSRPSNDESDTADLRHQAVAALDTGAFDEATRLLTVIRAREREASERRRRAAEEGRADWLAGLQAEAETCALLARAAMAQRDVAAAQVQFAEGCRVLAPADPKSRWSYALKAAGALYNLGDRAGLNEALAAAIHLYQLALADVPRDQVPLDWAMTQNNLGNALTILGARESGTARLEEAVTAYRAALLETTRERVPLDWAGTQTNLGSALWALGKRESSTARLEDAVTAHRAALEEWTRERLPLQWATAQNNLGNALQTLGARESGTARLEEAVTAYRAALLERTRERVPLDWAGTQNNLGNALRTLGARESGTARLDDAVTAYHAALLELTRERVPLQWATTQNNLGGAFQILGERESGTARLEEAVIAYRAALLETTRERVPLDWALTQKNLGAALQILGERESGTARLEDAVTAWEACLTVVSSAWPSEWVQSVRAHLDQARAEIVRRAGG